MNALSGTCQWRRPSSWPAEDSASETNGSSAQTSVLMTFQQAPLPPWGAGGLGRLEVWREAAGDGLEAETVGCIEAT